MKKIISNKQPKSSEIDATAVLRQFVNNGKLLETKGTTVLAQATVDQFEQLSIELEKLDSTQLIASFKTLEPKEQILLYLSYQLTLALPSQVSDSESSEGAGNPSALDVVQEFIEAIESELFGTMIRFLNNSFDLKLQNNSTDIAPLEYLLMNYIETLDQPKIESVSKHTSNLGIQQTINELAGKSQDLETRLSDAGLAGQGNEYIPFTATLTKLTV